MSLNPDVVQKAIQGRMHHHYIDLERSEMANARALVRDLGAEIERLTAENDRLRAALVEASAFIKKHDGGKFFDRLGAAYKIDSLVQQNALRSSDVD